MGILLLLAAVCANIVANLMFKNAMDAFPKQVDFQSLFSFAFNPFLWIGGICACMVLGFYLLAIKDSGLSTSYAFVTSISLVGITITSAFLFKETLSFQSIGGVAMVVIGIFLISTATTTGSANATPPTANIQAAE